MVDTFTDLQADIQARADGFVQRKSEFDTELDSFREFLGTVSKNMTILARGASTGQRGGKRGRKSAAATETSPPTAIAAE